MKKRAYYVRKPDGSLVMENEVAIPYETIEEARRVARSVMGTIGYWDWIGGKFVPRKRG